MPLAHAVGGDDGRLVEGGGEERAGCVGEVVGDEVDQVVTWQGNSDISSVGEMVAIRVKMFQAKVFAYRL